MTFDPSGTERVLDAVRAVDPRFAELPDVEDAQRRADHALIMAGSWVDVLDTFGRLAVQVPGTTVDDPWYGLGGSVSFTDGSGSTSNIRFRARITSRTLASLGGSGIFGVDETQFVSLVSTE